MRVVIAKRNAWKLVYICNEVDETGFYWINAGDPPTHSKATEYSIFKALEKLVANQA